jgi:HK97 family phage major capsid protein
VRTRAELVARMAELRTNITTLAGVSGDLSAEESERWSSLNTEWDELDAELSVLDGRARRLADINSRGVITATGDGAAGAAQHRARQGSFSLLRGVDADRIFDRSALRVDVEEDGVEWRSRAMRVIDSWRSPAEHQQSAAALVDNAPVSMRDRLVAEHILRTGSPDYCEGWRQYLLNPARLNTLPERMRAALNEGTSADGGFMVPPFLDPTIILANVGIANPFRSIATVKSVATAVWKGITSAGVTAEWSAEASEMADASPTVGQPVITPHRADCYVQASMEMLEDTSIATDVAMLFADARDRLEGAAFATGAGDSSNQPQGVIPGVTAVTASRVAATTARTFGAPDVFNVDNAMSQRYRPNARWAANRSIYNLARQFAIGSGGMTGSFWVDFGGAHPSTLIGYPVHEASAMDAALSTTGTANNVLVLGDFSHYFIVDRIGMSVAYLPVVLGTNRRPTAEVGWAAFWRTGAAVTVPDAFRVLQV